MVITGLQTQQQTRERGPYGWPVLAVSVAVFLALLLTRVPTVPLWAPGAGAVVMAVASYWALARTRGKAEGRLAVACWIGSAAWATWIGWAGWATPGSIVAGLVLLVAGGAGVAVAVALAPEPAAVVAPPPPVNVEHPKAAQLRTLLDQLLLNQQIRPAPGIGLGFTVTAFKMWEEDRGFTAVVDFPRGHRMTQKRVKEIADELAAEWRPSLQRGCTVRIKDGPHKSSAVVEMTLVNHLAKTVDYPVEKIRRRSSTEPHEVGFDAANKVVGIPIDQSSGLFNARRGGGKTILLQNLICEIAQCEDELLWVIDLNGGGVAVPFMAPYATDQIDRPVIDWVAFDPVEALAMSEVALAIGRDRKSFYAPLCARHDTDILPISPQVCGITILVDEGGEAFGQARDKLVQQVAENLLEVQRITRAMRIKLVVTSQRGTASYIPSDLKKATDVRACGLVEGDEEIAHILDWDRGLAATDLDVGEWFVRRHISEAPFKVKTYRQKPSIIRQVVEATSAWRPDLDERGRQVAATLGNGLIYEQRWERLRPWLRHIAGHAEDNVTPPPIIWDPPSLDDEQPDGRWKPGPSQSTATAGAVRSLADEMRERIQREVWGQGKSAEPTPPPASAEPDWLTEAQRGLDALPVLDGPRNTEPEPVEPTVNDQHSGPEPVALSEGQRWLLCHMANNPEGVRTLEVVEAATAAGRTERRATVSDWIAHLRDGVNPPLIEARGDYAAWILTDAGRLAAAQACHGQAAS